MKQAMMKKEKLEEILKSYGKTLIAFSGGVDSTFLLKAAHEIKGDDVIAVTLKSAVFPESENEFAEEFCRNEGIEQRVIDVDILGNTAFTENDKERCYTCKKFLFEHIVKLAEELGADQICEGSIADDDDDYRPGKKALAELGIKSPMKEVELTKEEIRHLSKKMNIPTWNKPSMACLASRIPYGEEITNSKLRMIEKAEEYLLSLGFDEVRVRAHGNLARIETSPRDIDKLLHDGLRSRIYNKFEVIGFTYVSVDLMGYRTGSMNEVL